MVSSYILLYRAAARFGFVNDETDETHTDVAAARDPGQDLREALPWYIHMTYSHTSTGIYTHTVRLTRCGEG